MSAVWKRFVDPEAGIVLDISNIGEVRTVERTITFSDNKPPRTYKPLILKQQKDRCGYMRVRISGEYGKVTYLVHRLVAITHIELPSDKQFKELQVNHKDGNKSNNWSGNLEWCTNGENQNHAIQNGLRGVYFGVNSLSGKYTTFVIDPKTNEITDVLVGNQQILAKGYDPRLVHKVVNGERKTHRKRNFVRVEFVFED